MMKKTPLVFMTLLCMAAPIAHVYATNAAPIRTETREEGATQKKKGTFGAESFSLINGMDVVVIPNHRVPVVTHMVWYRVGAADEQRGHSGLAHYLEHLMFKGSENVPAGEFSRRIKETGGHDNAFTSKDYTAYHQTVTRDNLALAMEMEADRMRGLLLPEADVKSEQQVVREERRERTENDPRSWLNEQLNAALFINHPYGIPTIGWDHEVQKITRDQVEDFYKTWYAPNNAILIVSGDITAEELKPMAEETYGTIPARNVPDRVWTDVPPLPALPLITLEHPSVRQPTFLRLYRVPSVSQNQQESLALEVLQEILSGGASTRLYRSLVVENRIATSIGMGYGGFSISDSTLWVSAYPVEGVSMEKLSDAINDQLRDVIKFGVTDIEMKEAIARLKDEAVYARDSISGPAMLFGYALATGASLESVEYWPENIEKVTAKQVQDVAARYLNPDDRAMRPYATGYLLPQAQVSKAEEKPRSAAMPAENVIEVEKLPEPRAEEPEKIITQEAPAEDAAEAPKADEVPEDPHEASEDREPDTEETPEEIEGEE